jgi:hypothetical protein
MPRDRENVDGAEDGAVKHRFTALVRTLGRGPGRSRALTREEAWTVLGMVLRDDADPH